MIVSEYNNSKDESAIQSGMSKINTIRIIHELYMYMKAKNTIYFYRKKRSFKFRNKKGWRI